MLYFNPEDSLDLATLVVNPLPNTFQVKDAKIQLYINGQPAAEGKPGDRLSLLDEKGKQVSNPSTFGLLKREKSFRNKPLWKTPTSPKLNSHQTVSSDYRN
ncbi:MAG: hypothetical protein R2792_09285 [Saprospiraceae bacterium]